MHTVTDSAGDVGGRVDEISAAEAVLLTRSAPHSFWTLTNLSEAFSGVLTPLGWSLVGTACETGTRKALHSIGALSRTESSYPTDESELAFGCFYGRAAMRVDFLAGISDRCPGASGAVVAEQFLGFVPDRIRNAPAHRRRYPVVLSRLPLIAVAIPRMVSENRRKTDALWRMETARGEIGLEDARLQFAAGVDALITAMRVDATKLLAGVQPVYEALNKLATAAGAETGALEAGHGSHEESEFLADLWRASRDEISIAEVVSRHGFHGTREGEVSGTVWREQPAALMSLAARYREMPDDSSPMAVEAEKRRQRELAERDLLAAIPRHRRPAAATIFRLAHRYLPLRGKAARLQGLDVARLAARRLGTLFADDGVLKEPDDVFFLHYREVLEMPESVQDLVQHRREVWSSYHGVELPISWEGMPVPVTSAERAPTTRQTDLLSGVGASAGVVEGRVRVIRDLDADGDAVRNGEVLVARTTDPSWSAVMFLSSALVVDIGGVLSHAAVVAREIGLPCVMGTGTGTESLRTGDLVRVDGSAGTVQLLEKAC